MVFRNVRIFPRALMRFLRNEISESLSRKSSYLSSFKQFDKWSKGLQFDERGDTLRMRSVFSAYPFGLIWVVLLIAGLDAGLRKGSLDLSDPRSALCVAALGFAGLVLLTIRSIDTSFDPVNRTIIYRRTLFSVVWLRSCFSFAETLGLLVKKNVDDGGGSLHLVLKDGSLRRLTHQNESATLERAMEAIHAATGITKLRYFAGYAHEP